MKNNPGQQSILNPTDTGRWVDTQRASSDWNTTLVIEISDPARAGSAFYVFQPPAEGAYTLDDIVRLGKRHDSYESALQAINSLYN